MELKNESVVSTETNVEKESKQKRLSRSQRKELKNQISSAKEALKKDKEARPKRKLSEKQLEALAAGRAKNPKLKAKTT